MPKLSEDGLFLPLEGFVVASAWFDYDGSLYPFVRVEFTNGEVLTVREVGQAGSIAFSVDTKEAGR